MTVHRIHDVSTGLRAIIAIHSTALGPAGGGVRFWPHATEQDAIEDAKRLARAMTYKYAAAGLPLGGGKAVIVGDPRTDKTEALLQAFGRAVERLNGEYYAAEDVGTTPADMEVLHRETRYLISLPERLGGPGDVAATTAQGTIEAMRACAERAWGSPDLRGRTVALQGLGAVGTHALKLLREHGARPTVTDIDGAKVRAAHADAVPPDGIYDLDADIFAPCALGPVIDDDTIARLKAKVVCGAANTILAHPRHADELDRRGIVHAVDFIANAGGTVYDDEMVAGRRRTFDHDRAQARVRQIFDRTKAVFALADAEGISCLRAAERLAEDRISRGDHERDRRT